MQTKLCITLEDLNWRIKNQPIMTIVTIINQICTIHIAFPSTKKRVVNNAQQKVRLMII